MGPDTDTRTGAAGEIATDVGRLEPTSEPLAIEVRDLQKAFRIPTHRISRLKERAANPFAGQKYRQLQALTDVSFDVHRGEFFGIVGRNGSGKSTLLKIMASIYRADAGSVRMAGRVAPFIELGVGFDMELSARENVVLNGVMMGLSAKESRRTLDQVLEFAELEEFVELKLKNYSSGMLVRLAFSVMIQADTDILLIDEVLAVGDAAFQQKCADVFHEMRGRKTIVFVTHSMAAVEEYCHRAMLLSKGEITHVGDPGDVARRYTQLNFEPGSGEAERPDLEDISGDVRILDIWLEGPDGSRIENIEQRDPIRIRAQLEARREVSDPVFGFIISNADDVYVHEFACGLPENDGGPRRLAAGQRVTVSVTAENQLAPGRFYLHHGVARNRNRYDTALIAPNVLRFVVFGDRQSPAVVGAQHEMQVIPDPEGAR